MIRIQLHLTEQQNRILRTMARERGASRADLIRRAIDLMLAQGFGERDALTELVGIAGSARRTDLAEHHDEVLYSAEPLALPRAAEESDDS